MKAHTTPPHAPPSNVRETKPCTDGQYPQAETLGEAGLRLSLYRREMNEGANDGGCTDPIGSQDSQFGVDSVIMDPKTKMHRSPSPHRAHLENKMRTRGNGERRGNEGGANHISRNHNNGIIIAVMRMLTILIPH